ncbi:RimJ/RimL family protein N-acetyltransferase [Brevibacterium sanguinis]|uniref:RimJ/RimL family protein N-acetyltransferase n=2 Tax=Brevibacterium TaxID=1696 RepID=A0A366IFB5_9MICO|nr:MULTISPECIES: GNAT family protein [Brevibacterium]RBP63390.1 RimJ/RimL family protein N-acetyltransferase [Brevibacterium sanguinis]RBP69857.1 RimJ/RimL family protein N-acetyltransferase [Brevibacterium celere]
MAPIPPFNQLSDVEQAVDYAENLFTGRYVRLRALREEDLPYLEQWWFDPSIVVLQNTTVLPWPEGGVSEQFQQWSANRDTSSVGFSIELTETEEFVGHVTLFGRNPINQSATLAIIVGPEFHGRGYGSDAVRLAVRYGFLQLGLNRIELQTWAFNARGIASYKKAGFVEEGRRREAVFFNGRRHDEVIMAILKDDWAGNR